MDLEKKFKLEQGTIWNWTDPTLPSTAPEKFLDKFYYYHFLLKFKKKIFFLLLLFSFLEPTITLQKNTLF